MIAYLVFEDFGENQEVTRVALTEEAAYAYIREQAARLFKLSRKSPLYKEYPLDFFLRYFRVAEVELLD